jgi:membrane protein YdbS with pleckstrin-like domain
MARPLIVREGPYIFLRNVLIMEAVAFVAFFAISLLGHYELIYKNLGLADYFRYDWFVILAFSIFQLIYISLLFLNWYFTHYEVTENEITRKSGLLFRRKKSVSFHDVVSVEIYQSPWSRPIHHATIVLEHQNGRVTRFKNVGNFAEYVHLIKQMIPTSRRRGAALSLEELIREGESSSLEFKESLRYDTRLNSINKDLEKAVMKTIAGFLNTDGGTLVIGVNDSGEILGLNRDYDSLPRKNRDGFENHLSALVKSMIGMNFSKYVALAFEKVDGKEVCLVRVKSSHKPAYLHNGDKREEFFVRTGNSTQPFSMSEAEDYIKTHFA